MNFFEKLFFEEIFLSSSYANTLTRKLASFKKNLSNFSCRLMQMQNKIKIKDTEIEISKDVEKTKKWKSR